MGNWAWGLFLSSVNNCDLQCSDPTPCSEQWGGGLGVTHCYGVGASIEDPLLGGRGAAAGFLGHDPGLKF